MGLPGLKSGEDDLKLKAEDGRCVRTACKEKGCLGKGVLSLRHGWFLEVDESGNVVR